MTETLPTSTKAPTLKRWESYRTGQDDHEGVKIDHVVHQTLKGAIYMSHGDGPCDNVRWDEEPRNDILWHQVISDAMDLIAQLKQSQKYGKTRVRGLRMIAAGMARALEHEPPTAEGIDFFASARQFVNVRQREILQMSYFGAAALCSLVITGILLSVYAAKITVEAGFFRAAALGSAGAIISVSQRFRRLELERYSSRWYMVVSGCSRVIFGAMFGVVAHLFVKAELLLPISKVNVFFTAAVAFVAGFSERAIPELLDQMEKQIVASGKARDAV
jgi:hypothetical protein